MEERKLFLNMNYNKEGPTVAFSKDKPLEMEPIQSPLSYQLPHPPSFPASSDDLSASSSSAIFPAASLFKLSSTDLRGKPQVSRKVAGDANISEPDSRLGLNPLMNTKTETADTQPAGGFSNEQNDQQTPHPTDPMTENRCREHSKAPQEFQSKVNQTTRSEEHWSLGVAGTAGREDADLTSERTSEGDGCGAHVRRRRWSSIVFPEQGRSNRDGIPTCANMKKAAVLPNKSSAAQRRGMYGAGMPDTSFQNYWIFLAGLVLYLLSTVPLASYVTGVSVGVVCGFIVGLVLAFVLAARCSGSTRKSCYAKPTNRQPLDGQPTAAETFEGWLTQTASYNTETFYRSARYPVFASLAGSRLRLSYQQACDGPTQESTCWPLRTYQLANSRVTLAPPGLARKRLWNKKYPICITLAEGEVGEENVEEGQEGEGSKRNAAIPEHNAPPVTFYLFARTGREKEEWFENLRSASTLGTTISDITVSSFLSLLTPMGGDADEGSREEHPNLPEPIWARKLLDYTADMTQLVDSDGCGRVQDSDAAQKKTPSNATEGARAESSADCEVEQDPAGGQTAWMNSIAGRIFWVFLHDQYWANVVACKIQQKLSKFKLKYFMSEMTLVDLDMGTCLPQILSISKPTLDSRGLWLDLQIMYSGCFRMTLQTKINLSRLGKEDQDEAQPERLSKLADSDEESSGVEDDVLPAEPQACGSETAAAAASADMNSAGSTSRKILNVMDKLAKSKYFQNTEYIRKKIDEVTNMPLMLTVEVLELSGTLAINIPPPPSDRIWYSFRAPPKLDLCVHPMLGEREVNFSQVTEWIERKLRAEFQKLFVMPNMDDFFVPLMTWPVKPFAPC
ncbi:testis-expressed protein 2-like isoform 1-T1 [Syngnathus typhle]